MGKELRNGMKVHVEYDAVIDDHHAGGGDLVIVRVDGRCVAAPASSITPIDDPGADPIGTVRRDPKTGRIYLKERRGVSGVDLYWWRLDDHPSEGSQNRCKDSEDVVGWETLGICPGFETK